MLKLNEPYDTGRGSLTGLVFRWTELKIDVRNSVAYVTVEVFPNAETAARASEKLDDPRAGRGLREDPRLVGFAVKPLTVLRNIRVEGEAFAAVAAGLSGPISDAVYAHLRATDETLAKAEDVALGS